MDTGSEFKALRRQNQGQKISLRPKILVVEDDITSEPIWEYILTQVDERAIMMWATSVGEAGRMIQRANSGGRPFDLVITDIFLSGSLTGFDLWWRFQKEMPGSIILMSAIEPTKVQKYIGDQGQPIFLQKPLNMEDAIETIFSLLQHPGP